jgi:hypothetical protein
MYQAIVVAAQKWQDTERACKAHALVLAERVHIHMRGYEAVGWSCKALPKGVLSR